MNNKTIEVYRVLIICLLLMLLASHKSWGQNSAQLVPETEESQDLLYEKNIQQMLISEGVPLIQPSESQEGVNLSTYTLGPNDVIEIGVLRHPEVSGQYIINKEGAIQYEFVGDLDLIGKTKDEATELIAKALSTYIISPAVTLKIIGYNSKVVYVVGEVGNPGKIFMRGDTITVREALVQAGLPLLTAKLTKGALITPSEDGKADQKRVNIHKLLYEGDLRENLVMKPGDTLYVPPTLMAKTMRTIQPVAAPIGTAAGTGRTVMTGF